MGLSIGLTAASFTPLALAETIGELAYFSGVRENVLVGYGLVVGLDGTGDQTTQAPFTGQSINNMLSQLGITVPQGTNMQLRNVASVMVTARMPAFSRPGQNIDVVVSSVGNAKAIHGGTLLMTPLKGSDGQIYAVAQGNILTGGAGAMAGGNEVRINQQAGGRIPRGGIVERSVELDMGRHDGQLELYLKEANPNTAREMVLAINNTFKKTIASAMDSGSIRLDGPLSANERVTFMARLNAIEVNVPKALPKVIYNARTGSLVLNDKVRLHRAAVSHGNLSIIIESTPVVSQPNPLAGGETVVTENSNVTIEQTGRGIHVLEEGADLNDVVKALNALGTTPQDMISILEALKAAGSLRADLEII